MSQTSKVTHSFGAVNTQGGSIQRLVGTTLGAVSLSSQFTTIATTGAATATLANGREGQEKVILMVTDGGDAVLTPANFGNGTTITFNDLGDCVKLVFASGKWYLISNVGATIA